MSRLASTPVRTFSIGFADDTRYDETSYARVAAEAFGTDHTEFRVEAGSVELLDELVAAYDQPFGDSSAIPTYVVSRLTRDAVTVALTGDGGDELFAGYLRLQWGAVAERLPRALTGLAGRMVRLMPHAADFRSLRRRAGRFLEAAALPTDERMLRWIGFFSAELDELLRPELKEGLTPDRLLSSFREPLGRSRGKSPLSRLLQLNFDTYLLDDLLVKSDRTSMACGLELRSPFLDTQLMEFAARLPDSYRVRRGRSKWILAQAFGDLLPPPILTRSKMGFGVPLAQWFRTSWRPLLEKELLGADSALWDWLEPDPVRTMARDHLNGRADHGHRLWALLTLDKWLRREGDQPSRAVEGSECFDDNSPAMAGV